MARDGRFLFLVLAMLFEELIEQHRVHSFIADCVRLALFVTSHQIRVYLFHLLGDQAKLRNPIRVKLVLAAEGDRLQRPDRFARLISPEFRPRFLEILEKISTTWQDKSHSSCVYSSDIRARVALPHGSFVSTNIYKCRCACS